MSHKIKNIILKLLQFREKNDRWIIQILGIFIKDIVITRDISNVV